MYRIEDDLIFCGDQASIQQMISILLDNAFKYSGENGQIQLDVAKKHRNIVIKVTNTCKMEHISDMDRLFDRFYRPDKSRSLATGGNGIGLSIAKAIAEAHNGSISACSKKEGTIQFQILL